MLWNMQQQVDGRWMQSDANWHIDSLETMHCSSDPLLKDVASIRVASVLSFLYVAQQDHVTLKQFEAIESAGSDG